MNTKRQYMKNDHDCVSIKLYLQYIRAHTTPQQFHFYLYTRGGQTPEVSQMFISSRTDQYIVAY